MIVIVQPAAFTFNFKFTVIILNKKIIVNISLPYLNYVISIHIDTGYCSPLIHTSLNLRQISTSHVCKYTISISLYNLNTRNSFSHLTSKSRQEYLTKSTSSCTKMRVIQIKELITRCTKRRIKN